MHRHLLIAAFVLGCSSYSSAQQSGTDTDPEHAAKRTKGLEVFRAEVRKTLKDKCVACHGGDSTEGKLDMATQEGLLKGGERGPAAVIGRGDKSLLTRLIKHQQKPHMPKDEPKLSEREIAAIVNWIDLGAPYDEPLVARKAEVTNWIERKVDPQAKSFWSFQPLKRVTPPSPQDAGGWCQSPVDQFILEKLNAEKLRPNPMVGRAALIRRVSFDITGLPPTADEVTAFENDPRPDAYERLIERLLADPHYGERWGRFWLDLARFAESHGFEHDYDRPSAYHYRDFVVQALNEGMPYDQFVRWQIAGDELAPNNRQAMMATGYHQERGREAPLRRDGRHAEHDRHVDAGTDHRLRPLSRSQVRSDPAGRLLPAVVDVHHDDPQRGRTRLRSRRLSTGAGSVREIAGTVRTGGPRLRSDAASAAVCRVAVEA
jgi:mono/diheme cytochrome c family protein